MFRQNPACARLDFLTGKRFCIGLKVLLWLVASTVAPSVLALETTKSVVSITDSGNNEFTAVYSVSLRNDSGVNNFDLQVTDDLSSEFGTPVVAVGQVDVPGEYFVSAVTVNTSAVVNGGNTGFLANAGFNGSGQSNLLQNGQPGSLFPNDVVTISFTVRFFPDSTSAPYVNTATGSADLVANGVPNGNVTDLSNTVTLDLVSALSAFACTNTLYLATGNPSLLNSINIGGNSLTPISGTSHGMLYTSIGYRPSNNLMYGLRSSTNQLVAVDANGTVVVIGAVTGLPNGIGFSSGGFIGNLLYVIPFGSNDLYAINVDALTATLIGSGTGLTDVFDIAVNPNDGLFYGVKDFAGTLVSINPANAVTTVIGATGLSGIGKGAAYFDSVGNFYLFQNSNGGLYHIDVSDADTTQISSLPNQTLSSGASCPTAGAPTPPLIGAALDASTLSDEGNNVFEVTLNVRIAGAAFAELFDIQATLDLATRFGALQASAVAVNAPGEYFVSVGTINTAGVTGGNTGFVANAGYTGAPGNTTLLNPAQPGSLDPDDFVIVPVTVTFFPAAANAPYTLQFTASGDSSANGVANGDVTDLSTDGTDPDDNGDIPGNDLDTDPTNTNSLTPVNLLSVLTPFACTNDLYIDINAPSQFNRVDFPTSSFVGIGGTATGLTSNGIGYHQGSNLIYGLEFTTNRLLAKDLNGTIAVLGSVTGLPAAAYGSGDFIGNDYYVLRFPTNEIYRIDITNRTATLVGNGTALGDVYEFAANPLDGQLYGVRDGTREVVRINPATAATTTLGTANTTGFAIDAVFFDNAGTFYIYQSSDGGVFRLDVNTGAATRLITIAPTTLAGGASCSAAPAPFAIEVGTAMNLVGLADLGATYRATYDLYIENTGNFQVFDVQAINALAATFGTATATLGDVDTAGEYFASVVSVNTAGVTNGGNATFAANAGFNGNTDTNVLNPAQPGSLQPNDFIVVRIEVTIAPNGVLTYNNQFTGAVDSIANGVANSTETDLSTTGTDFDLNGLVPGNDSDGDPNNTDSPTPLTFPDFDGDGITDPVDLDDDDDGYRDVDEGSTTIDTDGDGRPDSRDIDSDNDGITDNVELQAEGAYVAPSGNDTDNDGLDNAYDPDNGGTLLVAANTDGADQPDFRDTDTDNDGILDAIEGHDADANGVTDVLPANADADGDGLDNAYDTIVRPAVNNETGSNAPLQNRDGADARDWRDADDDNDGVTTLVEGGVANNADGDAFPDYLDADDFDGDGRPDTTDVDDDGDGIPDAAEGNGVTNTDGNGGADSLDIDSDNDGITDNVEAQAEGTYRAPANVDTDGDGLDNAYDPDNGGVAIVIANTDGADQPDFRDLDTDNDGIPDSIEGHDANANGVADVLPANADVDNDGLDNAYDIIVRPAVGNATGSNAPLQNSDGADNRDWRDTDDDNDGVPTLTEGGVGNNGDGDLRPDYLDADDLDGDGVPDTSDQDDDGDGIPDLTEGNGAIDSDGDGRADSRDIDSDNDGLTDNVEAQPEGLYRAPANVDTDNDGLDNAYDPDNGGVVIAPANTDGADQLDYLDADADNDGIPDSIEGHDANADGIADRVRVNTDTDGDGLDDVYDTVASPAAGNALGSNAPLQNTDALDNRDWRDADDDNDTVLTSVEGGVGNNNDGDTRPDYLDADNFDGDSRPDSVDTDDDGDGLPDVTEGNALVDTDGDGRPDSRDIDSDGDGIVDNVEAQAEGNYRAPAGTDTDNDGLDNRYDPDNGGTAIALANTDGADQPDFRDTDSDNDGVSDAIEGHDLNANGVADVVPAGADADADGLDNAYDTVVRPAAGNATGSNAPLQNTDGADNRDWRDTDDENDGQLTSTEDTNNNLNFADDDADRDGVPNYLDRDLGIDSDGDGLPDNVDPDADNDGVTDLVEGGGVTDPSLDHDNDGIPNFRDPQSPGFADGNADGVNDAVDADRDGVPNHLDIDSDGDGVPDNIEAQPPGNYRAPSRADTDNDGLDNTYDPDNGGTPITIANSDGADLPDYLDADSDNDGVPDATEAHDANADGRPDRTPRGADADGDGLDDAFDTVVRPGAGNSTGSNAVLNNTDNADTPDFRDADDDNDAVTTFNEDGNRNGNRADDDRDRDGIPDYLDPILDIATLGGTVFRDLDSDDVLDATDPRLANWRVELLQNGTLLATQVVSSNGTYSFPDLRPGAGYQLRLRHPDTNVTYLVLDGITLASGDNILDRNLPVDPSGLMYDTDSRTVLAGVRISVVDGSGNALPDVCVLPGQQNQLTGTDGGYRVDVLLGAAPACPSGGTFALRFIAPADYVDGPSATIPPQPGALDPTGQPSPLRVQLQANPPSGADSTRYFVQFILQSGDPDVIHNHVAMDPVGNFDVRLIKRAAKRTASIGDLVAYNIEVRNVGARLLTGLSLTDLIPPGFRFVENSVRTQPETIGLTVTGERPLLIGGLRVARGQIVRVSYLLRVGAGVGQGDYENRVNATLGTAPIGNVASATVQIVSDPDFEQTTIIGKVFDDQNANGWQDPGESGVPGVRLATVTGLLIETDVHGRYHLAAVDVERFDRGQNFYLKLDTTTLPEGSEVVSENPRVVRITQGLMSQINFAVKLQAPMAIEAIEVGDVFFDTGTSAVKSRYLSLLDDMAGRLKDRDGGEIVILSRAGEESLALARAQALRALLIERLADSAPNYAIIVQTEVEGDEVARLNDGRTAINAELFFDTDQATIGAEYQPLIDSLARQIREGCSGEIVVEGHADQRGRDVYNKGLSIRRTEAVRKALEAAGAFQPPAPKCPSAAPRSPLDNKPSGAPLGAIQGPGSSGVQMSSVLQRMLATVLAVVVPNAYAAESADPAAALGADDSCGLNYCASDEGVAVRILNYGEDKPRNPAATPEALHDNRAVSISGDVKMPISAEDAGNRDRASIRGRFRKELADGSSLWVTEDPLGGIPMLAFAPPAGIATLETGITGAISIPFYTNYADFMTRLELSIYRSTDVDRVAPIAVLEAMPRHLGEFLWAGASVKVDEEFIAVVRAYDGNGNFDETRLQNFVLADLNEFEPAERERLMPEGVDRWRAVYGRNDLTLQNIPLHASRIRLHGDVRGEVPEIRIDGDHLPLDEANRFAVEYLLPVGKHEFVVNIQRAGEVDQMQTVEAEVTGRYMFLAALADITLSDNKISGSVEPLSGDDRYDGDFMVDGRLAFYLKGKIKGRYLVTGQMDTREDEIGDIFKDIHRKDPDALFRRLDPDRYYPVYGDDSTTVADVNTMGRMYVRVDWDKSQVLWGNYDTGMTGTEFAQYNRSLYGARGEYNSTRTTELGEAKTHAKAFVSETQSAFGHAEFSGTGGSLYYLPHTDILPGSEKITLELRDRDSNRVVETLVMVRGQDYEIDEIQGRIILSRPLMQIRSRESSIVRNNPLDGDVPLVLVDYEYLPDDFSADHVTVGGRGKHWFGEHIAVGGTYVMEGRGAEDYDMHGLDVTLQQGRGTYLKLEYAGSTASQANSFFSDNGGLSFAQRSDTDARGRDGSAMSVEGRANLRELGWTRMDLTLGTWWRDSDDDFSVARRDVGFDLTEYGLEAAGRFNDAMGFVLRSSTVERDLVQDDIRSALFDWQLSDTNRLRVEVQQLESEDSFTGNKRDETVAAVELAHAFTESFEVFGGGQSTLQDSGSAADNNDLVFAGTRNRLTEKLRLETEVTYGHRGEGGTVGLDYARNERHSLYGSFTHSTDTTMLPGGGEAVTFGNRFRVSNQSTLFSENQFVAEDQGSGFTHSYGIDYSPRPGWSLGMSLQKGELDAVSGLVDRRAATLSGGYRSDRFNWRSVLELRKDKGAEERDQILTTNVADFRINESFRVLGKFNYSKTDDDLLGLVTGGKFTEAGVGLAYRPVDNDRLNLLAKYVYLYDLQSFGQFDAGLDQRSNIITAEALYRLSSRWGIGAKYGVRKGELRAERAQGDWFESTVNFASVRLRYNIMRKWDALAEYRRLEVEEDNSVRDGYLIGVDRQIGDNLQFGVGYNFTDFSDDLRILDYDQKGWYINIVGKI